MWRFLSVPLENLRLVMHSDAAFQNAPGCESQAGYIIAVSLGKRRFGTLEPVDLAKSQNASSSGQHPTCRNTESFEWSWARWMDCRTLY